MKKDDLTSRLNNAAARIRSLDDTEEIPILDYDFTPKKKKRKKKRRRRLKKAPFSALLGIALSILLALGITGAYLYVNLIGEEISLLDKTPLYYSGYNGKGEVQKGFTPEAAALKSLRSKADKMTKNGKDATALYNLADSVACGFNRTEGLSNGDTITYACSYNEEYAKAAHYRLKNTQSSYKVSDLPNLRVLDPFDGVSASWVLKTAGTDVSFSIPDLQNSLGIAYRWSYGTENRTYNGHSIFAEADYSSDTLASAGYVIETDTKEIEMGSMPEIIHDLNALTYEQQVSVVLQMQEALEMELAACSHTYTLNGSPVTVESFSNGYLTQDCATAWYEPDTAFTITFELQLDKHSTNNSWWNRLQSHSISYSGTIYRMSDGTVQFNNESNHGCYFAGYVGIYHVAEENESSEIFGGLQEGFNNFTNGLQQQAQEIIEQASGFIQEDGPVEEPPHNENSDHH